MTRDYSRELGTASANIAVTRTLYVSTTGNGSNGSSWMNAFTTIQAALDGASTDGGDLTLILIAPHATNYDIYTTGDPEWAANVILMGTHRNWAKIMNSHGSGTSILKLTGKSSINQLNFNLGAARNGVIMTHGGARGYHLQFIGESLTPGAKVALNLAGASNLKHAKFGDIHFLGEATGEFMTALKLDKCSLGHFYDIQTHNCLKGIQITDAVSDTNSFRHWDIGDCLHGNGIGIDIDAGNEQHFDDILFHENTVNVDDEVGDHLWTNIKGHFPITVIPDDISATGVDVATGDGANTWTGSPVQIRAGGDKPFRVIAYHIEADADERFRVRFSDGTTVFDDVLIEGTANAIKREASSFPSDTEFIFNKGIAISASSKSETVGVDHAFVTIEVQEI